MDEIWSSERWIRELAYAVEVQTKYKKKAQKMNPVNIPLPHGEKPGEAPTKKRLEGEVHAGKTIEWGSQLTPAWLAAMQIGTDFLSDLEIQLFVDILYKYKGALVWDDMEMGLLDSMIKPPVEIHCVPHEPWQQQNLRLPKAMCNTATRIVKEKLESRTLEYSQGPYWSQYFLVQKKEPSEFRLINDVQPLNKIAIRDMGMPPAVDEFSEEFAGYPIATSVDFYVGYH